MQYMTIVLELLKERTELHEQLRLTRRLLPTLEICGKELKASHERWIGLPVRDEARQRSEPDRQRSDGNGRAGTGGSFAIRVSSGRDGPPVPRPSNGFRPKSYADKVRPPRYRSSLFDSPPNDSSSPTPTPPEAITPSPLFPPITPPASTKTPDPNQTIQQRPRQCRWPAARRAKARDIIAAIRTLKDHRARIIGRRRRKKNKSLPASRDSARWPSRSSPIRSPANTRMPAGRPSARN